MISIRGATGVTENTQESIWLYSKQLLEQIIKENKIQAEDIISILFSATKDLTAAYPAPICRELGIYDAGILCVQEMNVENSMPMCIRILLHVNKDCCQKDAKHLYLNGAQNLRPDLAKK